MKKEIVKLINKMVDSNNFFKDIVIYFEKKMGTKNIYFLMPEQENSDFILKYPANGSNIRITKSELKIVSFYGFKKIIFPKIELKQNNYSIFKKTLLTKIRWKIWAHKISAIMPIYSNGEIICLIIFKGRFNDGWFDTNSKHLEEIKSIIEYCLGAIVLYNRALKRIIRNYQ